MTGAPGMKEYAAYIVDTEFVWGYQTNVAGLSKTPPSFTYPPPTTFLGAVTEAIAKREGLGESSYLRILNELVDPLVAIAIKPRNIYPMKTLDINKIIAVREASGKEFPNPDEPGNSFDAPARGKTIASPIDGIPTITWVIVFSKKPKLLKARDLWKIHRLGSKESIVSVMKVENIKAAIDETDTTLTSYSVPLKYVERFKPKAGSEWVIESYANPFDTFSDNSPATRYLIGNTILFASPINKSVREYSLATVRVKKEGALYRVSNERIVGVLKE